MGLTTTHDAGSIQRDLLVVDANRSVDVITVCGVRPGPKVAIVAGIHGDEYEGIVAVRELARLLQPADVAGSIVLVPVANPSALTAGTRLSPDDGCNLARCFPGKSDGGPTEQLAACLFHLLTEVDFLIDLHSGGVEYEFLPVAGFYGAANSRNPSFAAAGHMGLDALWQLPPTRGVLSYELHRRGKVVTGCEYLGAGRLAALGASRYCDGILECLKSWGCLASEPSTCDPAPAYEGEWQLAKANGLFEAAVDLGAVVAPGTRVATISSPNATILQEFYATRPGRVLAIRSKAYILSGNWGVLLGSRCEDAADA